MKFPPMVRPVTPAARRHSRGGNVWFLVLLGTVYLFNFADRAIIPVLAEPLRRELGLSDFRLGLLGGLSFTLLYVTLAIPLARLAERRSRVGLIAAVCTLWSLMTMLSGLATNFIQLFLCRLGVGLGESGITPALVSLLSDRFALNHRGAAFSLITLGAPAGTALAATVGGYIAEHYGWRIALFAFGAPGLLLALLLLLTIAEPARQDASQAEDTPPFGAVLKRLSRSSVFRNITLAGALVQFLAAGLHLFFIPLLMRRYGLDLAAAGGVYAVAVSLASAIGYLLGGALSSRLGRRDVRHYGWAPAVVVLAAAPIYALAILQSDWRALATLTFFVSAAVHAFLPTMMTLTQSLVEPRMRASTAALHSFAQVVGGMAIGSLTLGMLSDHLSRIFDTSCPQTLTACGASSGSGLQYALLISTAALPLAALLYASAARAMPRELGSTGAKPASISP